MSLFSDILFFLLFVFDVIGPFVLLVWLRRRHGNWRTAGIRAALIVPFASFLFLGGVCWFGAFINVVIQGDTSIPDENFHSVAEYLWFTFSVCGGYGLIVAFIGLALSLPVLLLWRFMHKLSFYRVMNCEPKVTS